MADLDEVSSQIGKLIAITEATRNQVGTLFTKYDRLNDEVIEQRGAIKILGQQFMEHRTEDSAAHKTFKEVKDDVEATKNKGKGLAIALGVVGGGGGLAGFGAAFKHLFGH